jgi:hypothetical protein
MNVMRTNTQAETVKTTETASKSKLIKGTKKQQAPRPCLPMYNV